MTIDKTLILSYIIHVVRKIFYARQALLKKIFLSFVLQEHGYTALAADKTYNAYNMRMSALFLFLILYLFHHPLNAQQLTGFTYDDKGKPLSGVSVALKNSK